MSDSQRRRDLDKAFYDLEQLQQWKADASVKLAELAAARKELDEWHGESMTEDIDTAGVAALVVGAATHLEEEVARLRTAQQTTTAPRCYLDDCDKVATCVGEYEGNRGEIHFVCDTHCGHGNEDGWCVPIEDALEELRSRLSAAYEHLHRVDP